MDFLDELMHSWGKSPEQKKHEKEYNAEYYKKNKEKWKNAKTGRAIPDNLPFIKDHIKTAGKNGSYAYLPTGVYPRTEREEQEWADAGFSYDESTGRWRWSASALRKRISLESSQSHAADEKARLDKAKKKAVAYERGQNEKARLDEAKKQYDKHEWTQTVKRRSEEYIRKKPYLDSLAQAKKEANQPAAKKARKFIDGYVEYTLDGVKEKSKKASALVKDFFGW